TAAVGQDGYQYRALFTNACSSMATTPALLTVNSAPHITVCPGNSTVSTDPGQCSASVAIAATVTGSPVPTLVYQVGPTTITSPYPFPLGAPPVLCTATNALGKDTCRFTVTVLDTEKPAITAPPPVSASTDAGKCTASSVSLGAPTTSDNCGVAS